MAYSIVEVAESSGSFNGSASVSLSTTPIAGDIVVVAFSCSNTNSITAISGLGATWSTEYEISSSGITHLFRMGVGASASGSISITLSQSGAGARNGLVRAYLIRGGGTSPTIAGVTATNFNATGLTGPSQTADADDLVITQMGSQTSTRAISWPSAQSPSGAFTVGSQATAGSNTFNTGYAAPASSASHSTTMAFTSGSGAVTNRISQITLTTTMTAGSTGTVAATAGSPIVALTGTVPVIGAVVASASSPAVAVAGSVGGTTTGTVNAEASSPVVAIEELVVTPISMEFLIGTSLDISNILDVTPMAMEFLVDTAFRITIPDEQPADPRTGAPQYRWVITHRDGTRYGELYDVTADGVEQSLNETGLTRFTIPTDHPAFGLVQPIVRECQVWRGTTMLHKGPIMVGRESDDGATTTFEVPDPRWYYEHGRFLAKVPRTNVLRNGGFTLGTGGFGYWRASFEPDSIPALPPLWEVIGDDETLSGKALIVQGADETQLEVRDVETASVFIPNTPDYLPGGEAQIEAIGDDIPDDAVVSIVGHTANDGTGDGLELSLYRALSAEVTLTAQNPSWTYELPSNWESIPSDERMDDGEVGGRGYYQPKASNATEAGMAQNRRVTIAWEGTLSAEGHKQYVGSSTYVSQPVSAKYPMVFTANARYKLLEFVAPSADGYNILVRVVRVSDGVEIDRSTSSISEDTPLNRWFDIETSVTIPADGQQYRIDVRLYPPAGSAEFADVGLYPEELLFFWGVDQAHIVRDIVAFIQANGWTDLGITTRTPKTGILRDRTYELTNGSPIPAAQALEEFPSLARGFDIGMTLDHDLTRLETYYPRQGGPSGVSLVEGGAVVESRPTSSHDVYSLVVMRANSGGAYRPEALAKDAAALDGLLLGKYQTAEAERPVTELDEGARAELSRSKGAVSGWWVQCDPAWTSELMTRLHLGDTCRLVLPSRDFDGLVRVVKVVPDPETDALAFLLTVED